MKESELVFLSFHVTCHSNCHATLLAVAQTVIAFCSKKCLVSNFLEEEIRQQSSQGSLFFGSILYKDVKYFSLKLH